MSGIVSVSVNQKHYHGRSSMLENVVGAIIFIGIVIAISLWTIGQHVDWIATLF